MRKGLRLLVTLVAILGCGLVAEARVKTAVDSPIDIAFDADLRRDARDQRVADLELRIQSLIGADAHAAGDYSLYVDGVRTSRNSFDTRDGSSLDARDADDRSSRDSRTASDTVAIDAATYDAIVCAVVDIRSATLFGRHAPMLEKVHTRCVSLKPEVRVEAMSSRDRLSRSAQDNLGKPVGEEYELRFDEPLKIGVLSLSWLRLFDSRCPEQDESGAEVNCFWAGAATVVMGVSVGSFQLPPVVLTLGPSTAGSPVIVLGGNSIRLLSVSPYPVYNQPTPREEYVATILVSPHLEMARD